MNGERLNFYKTEYELRKFDADDTNFNERERSCISPSVRRLLSQEKKMRFVVLIFFTLFLACSIKTPEITLTGEKTALENQILGAYDQLTDNNLITTSVRTSSTPQENGQRRIVREAVQKQEIIKVQVDKLKRDKVVGENNKGYLEILDSDRYKKDASFRKMVDALVEQENHNRRIIYQRVLALNHSDRNSYDDAATIFAKMQHEKTAPGTMIQLMNGRWIEKTEEHE